MKKIAFRSTLTKMMAGILTVSLLTGCGSNPTPTTQTEDSTKDVKEEASVSEIDTSVMTPWLNSNIIDIVTDETNPDLKDDFYLNVNHDYFMDVSLRPGYSNETPFFDAADTVKERCLDREMRSCHKAFMSCSLTGKQEMSRALNR